MCHQARLLNEHFFFLFISKFYIDLTFAFPVAAIQASREGPQQSPFLDSPLCATPIFRVGTNWLAPNKQNVTSKIRFGKPGFHLERTLLLSLQLLAPGKPAVKL